MALSQQMGARIRRREDPRLITGTATYTDDLPPPGLLHLVFIRSYLAHARISPIDTEAAAQAPGVVRVFTGADLRGRPDFPVSGPKGSQLPRRPVLNGVGQKVRFAGDLIGAVVADSRELAVDAAELVGLELEPLPAV